MNFSIIYSFDIPCDRSVKDYKPRFPKLWTMTERHDNELNEWNGEWKSKHRKFVGVLTKEQLATCLDSYGMNYLEIEDVDTMGSLGSPGCGPGLSPAVSFFGTQEVVCSFLKKYDGYTEEQTSPGYCILSAYVVPLPNKPMKTYADFERIKQAMLNVFC